MYEEAYQNEALTLRQAMVNETSSCRPISQTGLDTEILCKVLARRLVSHI